MAHYQQQGSIPPKRHTQHRRPTGDGSQGELYYEELMGEEGFSSDSSLLYHRNIPSTIAGAREWEVGDLSTTPNHPLMPRHLEAARPLRRRGACQLTDVVTGRRLVLGNGDVRISYAVAGAPSPWYRNGIGDECVYVERGAARVETVFGAFDVAQGDYLVIPRATTHRWLPAGVGGGAAAGLLHRGQQPHRAAEALPEQVRPAARARAVLRARPARAARPAAGRGRRRRRDGRDRGLHQAPRATGPGRDRRDGAHPAVPPARRRRAGTAASTPTPSTSRDFEPITGRVHQPPPVHQVFEGVELRHLQLRAAQGGLPPAVDPGALLPLQRRQRRDHVLRRRRLRGAQGLRHRPGLDLACTRAATRTARSRARPRRSIGVEYFDELAVMVDTFRPLELGEGGRAVDDGQYAWSWSGGRTEPGGGPTTPSADGATAPVENPFRHVAHPVPSGA